MNSLSSKTILQVQDAIGRFSPRYKRDWQTWMAVKATGPLTQPETVAAFRDVLRRWQAVRSRTKGRIVRLLKSSGDPSGLYIDDVLARVVAPLEVLGIATVREVPTLGDAQRAALEDLWNVFRDLPNIGHANAVGITKAVQLVTGGRIGPALDTEVRRHLGIPEPRTPDQWLSVLRVVSDDLGTFESRNRCRIEGLVEHEWQPVAVGRAYDMVFGPKARPS